MAGCWQFDEGSGTTTADQVTGTQATLPSGVSWSSNIASIFSTGSSLQFSSASGPLQTSGNDLGTGDFTASAWSIGCRCRQGL